MIKRDTGTLVGVTLMSLILTSTLISKPVSALGQVTRTNGYDRYATAAQLAKTNWSYGTKNVILVTGEGYADAISASSLAKKLDAPILLTNSETLNIDAKSALDALRPQNIYIIGGYASISQGVRNTLRGYGYNLIELQGENRYQTNVEVAKKLVELGVKADNVLLVSGQGFSDALSVAPVAAAKGQILLLGNNDDEAMRPVINFVRANNSKVTVIGTRNVIGNYMYNQLGAIDRVDGGDTRFETNINVLNKFDSVLKSDKLFVANASGDGYADALVASALAGKSSSPLVLVDTYGTYATNNATNYIKRKATSYTDVNVIGGTGVVSESMVYDIRDSIGRTNHNNRSSSIQSIEPVSLNQVKIHFNTDVDEDSAEDVTNYKIDGTQLTRLDNGMAKDENGACATKIDSNTVLITLAKPRKQYSKVAILVKKGILTEDKNSTIDKFEDTVTFSDTTFPTLTKVSVEGNRQLTVEFSEAVNIKSINELKSKFKIDGSSLGNYGVNTEYSEIKDRVEVKNSSYGSTGIWANKVTLYLDSAIESGSHTLKISAGDSNGVLGDAAGFYVQETTEDFHVDNMSSKPYIRSVTEENGKISITFDRPMDIQTAKKLSNYEINDRKLTSINGAYIETDKDDTVIRLKHISDGTIKTGSNTLYISDNVKDAFGNRVDKDTRQNFTHDRDETKPRVSNVYVLDSETIFLRFSKDVNYRYAHNISNYKLKDNKGIDITDHIRGIYSTAGENDTGNTDTYHIKLNKYNPDDRNDQWRLNSSNYTLTIKNIEDTSSTPNIMDQDTFTLNGSDDVAPRGVGIYAKLRSSDTDRDKVIIYFNEPMDASTITDKKNYNFVNGDGENTALPSDTIVSCGGDDKSAVIEFPSNYHVKTTGRVITGSGNDVTGVLVFNVRDRGGNSLGDISYNNGSKIDSSQDGAKVKSRTLKLYYDGDDLKADVQFSRSIEEAVASDFTLGGIKPNTARPHGSIVTLTFKENEEATADEKAAHPLIYANGKVNQNPTKIELVKAQGQNARIDIISTGTIDETGARVSRDGDDNDKVSYLSYDQSSIYNYQAPPRTTCSKDTKPDYWSASREFDGGKIYITFDTPLSSHSGTRADGFTFMGSNGTSITPDSIDVDGTTLIFTFNSDNRYFKAFDSSTIDVGINNNVSIETLKDAEGSHADYKPSNDDIKMRTVSISVSNVKTLEGATLVDAAGLENNGKTQFNLSGVTKVNAEDTFKYIISTTDKPISMPNLGENLSSWTTVEDGNTVTVANGTHIGIAEVDAKGRAVKFIDKTAVVKDYVTPTAGKVTASNAADLKTVMTSKVGSIVVNVNGTDASHTFTLPLDNHIPFTDVSALATAIGAAINDSATPLNTAADVTVVDGKIVITSKATGSASTVAVTATGKDSADVFKLTGFAGTETGKGTAAAN